MGGSPLAGASSMPDERSKTWGTVAQWVAIAVTVGSLVAGGIFAMGMYRGDMDYLKQAAIKLTPMSDTMNKLSTDFYSLRDDRVSSKQRYEVFKDHTEDRLTNLEALIPVVKDQLVEIKNDIKELRKQNKADNLEQFR